MNTVKIAQKHPTDTELADLLDGNIDSTAKKLIESHLSSCDECLAKVATAHYAIVKFKKESQKNQRNGFMKKINPYLLLALLTFSLSFVTPRFFIQLLVATILLGMKWIVDAKSTKMLVMIYEAWKTGGEKEAGRILETIDLEKKKRF